MALVGKSGAGTLQTLALFSPNFSTERILRRLLLVLGGLGTFIGVGADTVLLEADVDKKTGLTRSFKIVAASSPSELFKVVNYTTLQLPPTTVGEYLRRR
jgi:hypothetical protein